MLTFGELFAGVGGFGLGLEQAGWECRFQVEWDKDCLQTLEYHWPDIPRFGDIQEVRGSDLEPVDVIAFGSPCQDLSVAGNRTGLHGERSSLFFEAMRVIREMKEKTNGIYPRWIIWENVAGALNSRGGDDFERVLQEMVEVGSYHIEWHVVDAQYFGVPQRRRRIFVISGRDFRTAKLGGIFPLSEGSGGYSPKGLTAKQTSPRPDDRCSTENHRQVEYLCFDTQFGSNADVFEEISPPLKSSQQAPSVVSLTRRQVRKMTPLECERLMGWPDNHTLYRADGGLNSVTTRQRMCGNGVVSPVAKWVATHINAAEKEMVRDDCPMPRHPTPYSRSHRS